MRNYKRRSSRRHPSGLFSISSSGCLKSRARHFQPRFEQLEPRLLLATTTAINSGNWLSASTWDIGVPTLADDAIVPSAFTVSLAGANQVAKTLLVQGTVEVVENGVTNKTLSADWILVDGGAFRVGTSLNPYDTNTFTLTLEGDNPTQNLPSLGITSNDAFLMTRSGGTLDLFGEAETSWTQLGATALAGATSITLKEAVTWDIGDEIVIASTTFDMNEAETRIITSVSGDQKTYGLSSALSFTHYGELQFYDNGKGTNYELDERAEVGLLSRNIKIQGDADSTVDGIGGNLMFMNGSGAVHIDGVEFYHMGQKAQLARYPIHWHQANDRTGDYVENTSIHRTFNRALTIHASQNIRVEQTVAYDHIGHGYFLEDAVETGNKFYYNLGLVTREPLPGEELLPSDLGPKQFQISGPGTFWITNPDNEFVGNVAGGSQTGSGFWYALPTGPLGPSANDPQYSGIRPQTTALRLFEGNRAHSNAIGLDVDGGPNVFTGVAESAHYNPPVDANFSDFTAFANDKNGVYFRGTARLKLPNARLADNVQGTMFAFGQTISDSLIVGVSGNDFGGAIKHGFAVYDGPNTVRNVHFAGFNHPRAGLFSVIGAANRHANHIFEEITFDDPSTPFSFPDTTVNSLLSRHWGFSLYDSDGTLTGTAGQSIIFNHPMMRSDGDVVLPTWKKAAVSQRRFGHLKLDHSLAAGDQPVVTFTRSDGPGAIASHTDIPLFEPFTQIGVILNTDFVYAISYETELKNNQFNVNIEEVGASDFVYLRVMNPWSGITANSAIAKTSEQSVRNSNQSAYYIEPTGDIFLKVYGLDSVNLLEAPAPFLYADFESGVDSRASLAESNPGLAGPLNFSGTFGGDGVNYWRVVDNGDEFDGFVDMHYRFATPQDATGFDDLLISTANENNTQMQIFIHDVSAGFTNLGIVQTGDQSASLTGVAATSRDQIDDILIRVYESYFSDLETPNNYTQINLKNLAVTVTGSSTVIDIADFESGIDPSVSLSATTFEIQGALGFDSNSGGDGINYWDVFDNGDGINGFVDLHMSFGPEDWSGLGGLRINTSNELSTPVQIFIRDVSAGYTQPWDIPTGDQWISLSGIDPANRDQIDDLIIRVQENFFSDLVSPGNKIRVHLKHIEATFVDPNPPLPSADFDTDGDVDGFDFLAWQRGFATPSAAKLDGDADNDLDVDNQDLIIWQSQFGTSAAIAAAGTSAPQSEPATVEEEEVLEPSVTSNLTPPLVRDEALGELRLQDSRFSLAGLLEPVTKNLPTQTRSVNERNLDLSRSSVHSNSEKEALAPDHDFQETKALFAMRSLRLAGEQTEIDDTTIDDFFALFEEDALIPGWLLIP